MTQPANPKVINNQTVTVPQLQSQSQPQSQSQAQPQSQTQLQSNGAPQAVSNENQETNQSSNGVITNGHPSNQANGSNIANRRVPKSKWVPLDIDIPKVRGKPRERNNNTTQRPSTETSTRSQPTGNSSSEYADREQRSSRRYGDRRPTNTRGSGTTNSSIHPSSKPIPNSVRPNTASNPTRPMNPSSVNTSRRPGPIRSSGGIPKSTRVNRISNHHHNQTGKIKSTHISLSKSLFTNQIMIILEQSIGVEFPVDYSLVKKMVPDTTTGQPYLMPFLGTSYYYNVPSYPNIDATNEAIRKQMLVFGRH